MRTLVKQVNEMAATSNEDVFAILAVVPSVRACSEEELSTIECQLGVELPAVYRRVLLVAGNQFPANSMMFSVGSLVSSRLEWLVSAEEEGVAIPNPEQAIFFDEADGFEVYFFVADGTADPLVYSLNYYSASENPVPQTRLSDFLAMSLRKSLGL